MNQFFFFFRLVSFKMKNKVKTNVLSKIENSTNNNFNNKLINNLLIHLGLNKKFLPRNFYYKAMETNEKIYKRLSHINIFGHVFFFFQKKNFLVTVNFSKFSILQAFY